MTIGRQTVMIPASNFVFKTFFKMSNYNRFKIELKICGRSWKSRHSKSSYARQSFNSSHRRQLTVTPANAHM